MRLYDSIAEVLAEGLLEYIVLVNVGGGDELVEHYFQIFCNQTN